MPRNIYIWAADGTDPRFEGKEVRFYFGFKASMMQVITTLKHLLGYDPVVADSMPLMEPVDHRLFIANEDGSVTTKVNLRVQGHDFKNIVVPVGTTLNLVKQGSLLYSQPSGQ